MSQKIYVLTEEKLIELLDKQKEICLAYPYFFFQSNKKPTTITQQNLA